MEAVVPAFHPFSREGHSLASLTARGSAWEKEDLGFTNLGATRSQVKKENSRERVYYFLSACYGLCLPS